MRSLLAAKIHKATVTQADLAYIGSITIDQTLCDMLDIWDGEKVLVVSNTSGARLETYVLYGEKNSGTICMNGAAAHLIQKGEEIIIMTFQTSEQPITPKAMLVDAKNQFVQWL